MFRSDVIWLIPAILIAVFQLKIVWSKLPHTKEEDTEIKGIYREKERQEYTYIYYLTLFILVIQISQPILGIGSNKLLLFQRIFGYVLIVLGFTTSLKSLKDLGVNWTGMMEYRIKKGQMLITQGIYKYVRHPIYLAIILEVTGFELIANSWLFIPAFILSFSYISKHIHNEEELLMVKFKEEYRTYSQKTKKLFPFLY